MYDDDRRRHTGRLPELPIPPQRRRITRAGLAVAVFAACALGAAAAVPLFPHSGGAPSHAPQAHTSIPNGPGITRPQSGAPTPLPSRCPIYRLLPLTASQLTAAAHVAAAFTDAYGTYSFTQPAATYLARLRPYTAPGLQAQLAQAATTPGLLQQRTRQHTSATTTAAVTAIRDIASTTVTFVVTARQMPHPAARPSAAIKEYAVTVAPSTDGWLVYDIEPADAGQAGSTS